jgi:hypothetical protein
MNEPIIETEIDYTEIPVEVIRTSRLTGCRYVMLCWSKSSHCCFQYTIMDSQAFTEEQRYPNGVCECFDREEAITVLNALNQSKK